jgi:hypothetical protein
VSIDPIHGTDQALSTYWAIIHKYFHVNKKFESDRFQKSLMNCWSGIQHDVNVDGNKSLYLVFVGVFFLSILDCF